MLTLCEDVKQATGFQDVELRVVDLADFASIPPFVNGIVQDIGHVDLLILNAGVNTGRHETTKDGWELVSVPFTRNSKFGSHVILLQAPYQQPWTRALNAAPSSCYVQR